MPHPVLKCADIVRAVRRYARSVGADPVEDGVNANSFGAILGNRVRDWNKVDGTVYTLQEVFLRHMRGMAVIEGTHNEAIIRLTTTGAAIADIAAAAPPPPHEAPADPSAWPDRLMNVIQEVKESGADVRGATVGSALRRAWPNWKADTGFGTLRAVIASLLPGRAAMAIDSDRIRLISKASKGRAAPRRPAPSRTAAPAHLRPPSPEPAVMAVPADGGAPFLLNKLEQLKFLRQRMIGARGTCACVALDCEGVNLGPERDSLTLVQLAFDDGTILIVDVLAEPGLLYGMRAFLEDPDVTKVVHDCRMDAAAIRAAAGIQLAGVFDTQVAYMGLHPRSLALPGLHTVLDEYAPAVPGADPDKAARLKAKMRDRMRRSPDMWAARPLDRDALAYASDDVARLLRAWRRMREAQQQSAALDVAEFERRCAVRCGSSAAGGVDNEPAAPVTVLETGWLTFEADGDGVARWPRRTPDPDAGEAAGKADSAELARAAQAAMAAEWAEAHGDLDELLAVLPADFAAFAKGSLGRGDLLVDLAMDLGRPPHARVYGADGRRRTLRMDGYKTTEADLQLVCANVQFGNKNRAGIPGTLHRVSAMRNASGGVYGLTARVGRWFHGAELMAPDLVRSSASLLVVGRPGAGKTTALRDIARLKAETESVVIVDTSSEIAGVGDVAHSSVGHARRMTVPEVEAQHAVMIEAVQNHTPDVIVIDEIGTRAEAGAARSISQRGIQLIATAHGRVVADLVRSNDMNELVGGKNTVILSTMVARERNCAQTQVERRGTASFSVAVEMVGSEHWVLHHNVNRTVDAILSSKPYEVEVRRRVMVDGQLRLVYSKELHTAASAQDDGDE